MDILLEIFLISTLTAIACALPGNFLVIRGNFLTAFALSHSILFGIMMVFLITGDINSPFLIIGAALVGMLIVWLVELLSKSRFVNIDAALGIIYLFIFSLGIILVAQYASSTNISIKSVVTGSIALVPFDRFIYNGTDLGPKLIWIIGGILLLDIIFIVLFYKELKITLFDPVYASLLGFNTALINILLMSLVSLTIVSVFKVAGVVLAVALMIIPPATAYILTDKLSKMIIISVILAFLSSTIGFFIAIQLKEVELASIISIVAGIFFLLALLFSPKIDFFRRIKG